MSESATPGLMSLGELIKASRQKKGLTLRELSEDPDVGVTATFLSRVERNDALPSDELVLKLARRLDFDASSALLQLFREKASPEVREFVPRASVLKVQEGTGGGEDLAGLEEMAEPISQVLDVHRRVVEENQRLRGEISRLGDSVQDLSREVAEGKRGFLPDVNRFLMSLFNYQSEVVRRETVVNRSGDATVTVTFEGITPKRGANPIRSLVHSVYIPQAVDGSLNIAGHPTRFEILEKPSGLRVDCSFKRESPERGAFLVSFPDGFHGSSGAGKLSYQFSYRLEKPFVMTLEDAKATYGKRSIHSDPFEWSSCFINKPVKRLEISVSFPEGYSPHYIDKWVWWTETSFLECDYNLADKLLLDTEDGIEIEQKERTTVRLRATNPLLGFSYGIVWQPLSKRQFLDLIRS